MSEGDVDRIKELNKTKRAALILIGKGQARFFEAAAELAALEGDDKIASAFNVKVEKRKKKNQKNQKNQKDQKAGKKTPVKKAKEAAKLSTPKPIPKKKASQEKSDEAADFECKASEITGEPCMAAAAGKPVVKAPATLFNKRRYPTCKACKKAAVAKAKPEKEAQENAETPEKADSSSSLEHEPMEIEAESE